MNRTLLTIWLLLCAGLASGRSRVVLFSPSTYNVSDAVDDQSGYYRGDTLYEAVYNHRPLPDKSYTLCFDGVNQEAWVCVNGDSVGYHAGGYTRFFFDITNFLHSGGNIISVRVNNAYNANIPPLSADFTFFGGIYREAYVLETSSAHIVPDGVCVTTPEVSEQEAEVVIATEWVNPYRQKVRLHYEIQDPDGRIVYSGKEGRCTIAGPQLWSPGSPRLYAVTVQVIDRRNHVLDEVTTRFGLRYYRFDPDKGFFLNGEHLKLIGTNRHQDEVGYGNALESWQHTRDIQMIKSMGANFLRVSHYPQDRRVMDLCDSLGLLCSVEIPVVNAISESEAFYDNCSMMLEEMIRQNRNHPSVIIWCFMNEVLLKPPFEKYSQRDSIYRIHVAALAKKLNKQCKDSDPERYTMMAFNSDFKYNQSAALYDITDIIGANMYQGWYSGKMTGFEEQVAKIHNSYPNKPIIVSEYGADCDVRLRSKQPVRMDYSVDYALLYHQHYWPVIRDTEYIAGAAVWNFNDFHSEARGGAIPHFNLKGLVTSNRQPKAVYYYYQKELTGINNRIDSFPQTNHNNFLLGTKRVFTDTKTGETWQPINAQWITGGENYSVKTRYGRLPANDHNIYGTDLDPLYQTAVIGASEIRIPVQNGNYDVTLYFAELQNNEQPDTCVYNLGNDAIKDDFAGREYTVSVNGSPPVTLATNRQLNAYTAYNITQKITVTDGYIQIQMKADKGQTLLNAIRIKQLND